jgi:hypothetical protein
MRTNSETLDIEVLRHYQAMRNSLFSFMHTWLALEQLTRTEGLEHHDAISDESWLQASANVLTAVECLVDIVTHSADPIPIHWLQWRVDTANQLQQLDERIALVLKSAMRP